MSTFPKSVAAVHQIEITSRCNLRCIYCPSPAIVAGKYKGRQAVDMTREHFERALAWAAFYVRQGTQSELNLAGIGESTLHPEFPSFVRMAREAVGSRVRLIFSTNGIIHDEDMVKAIAPYDPHVFVSLHRPEKAGRAIEMYRRYGLLKGVSGDPALNANDWAGQVEWMSYGAPLRCQWLQDGKVFVLADGRISTCCLDAQGIGIVGHVDDPVGSVQTKPYELCKKCYQSIDAPGWDQRMGVAQ